MPQQPRVLVIEDNPANLELARYLLAAVGHEVLVATDGAQGLALARSGAPDLIVSDLQMPGMDGYAFIAALRDDPGCRHLPVLALTAFSMPGDEERILQAGFTAYLAKPFEPEDFARHIADLLALHTRSRGASPRGR